MCWLQFSLCYYNSCAGVEEDDSTFLEYGATYWGKWFLAFRAAASKLITQSLNSLPLKTKAGRYFSKQQTASSEELWFPEDANLPAVN
jgi:hypothetical protein